MNNHAQMTYKRKEFVCSGDYKGAIVELNMVVTIDKDSDVHEAYQNLTSRVDRSVKSMAWCLVQMGNNNT